MTGIRTPNRAWHNQPAVWISNRWFGHKQPVVWTPKQCDGSYTRFAKAAVAVEQLLWSEYYRYFGRNNTDVNDRGT